MTAKKSGKTPATPNTTKPRTRSDGSATGANREKQAAKPLTPRQHLFVLEYLKDQNATAAYRRAGYAGTPEAVKANAARLITNDNVRAAIDAGLAELRQKVQDETSVSLKRVIEEIAKGAFFDPRAMFNADGSPKPITELEDREASALAGFEVLEQFEGAGPDRVFVGYLKKFKLSERKGYLDMLMKHLGGYKVDNEQKGGALADLLAQVSRSALPIAKTVADDDGTPH
jgi:phage terminase small subunit